jgi:hypothetical protein
MRVLLGLVPIAILLAVATFHSFERGLQPSDAGYVALHVADNVRSGQGFIFNAGERRDLVDSALWVSLLTLMSFARLAPTFLQALGLVLACGVVLVMLRSTKSALLGAGAALFLSVDRLFVEQVTAGGSEILAALYLVLLYRVLRGTRVRSAGLTAEDKALAIWAAFAPLVRYELILVAIPVAFGAGLREPRRPWAWLPAAAAALGAGIVLGLRWSYFGAWPAYWEPWPPHGDAIRAAAKHLFDILMRRPLLLLGVGIFLAEWIRGRLWLGRRVGLAWGLTALLFFALLPAAGLDVQRHVAALLPLAYVMSVETVWRRPRTRPGVVAALLLILAQPGWTSGRPTSAEGDSDSDSDAGYARVGQWLYVNAQPGTVVGAERVGALGYYSRMKMEDVEGRVSPRVGAVRHGTVEPDSLRFQPMLRQEPDLVLVLPGDPVPPSSIYVPNDDAIPDVIRGPYRVYRWAGNPVWVDTTAVR